jgi:putative ABC transport system permease protein
MRLVRFERVVRMAVKNLSQYKMRAGLTVLGIIFGVCSVVAMLSVGEGASQEIQEQLKRLGSRNILIKSMKLPEEKLSGGQTQGGSALAEYGITFEDLKRLSIYVPNLESITPLKTIRADIRRGDQNAEANIVPTVPWWPSITNHRMLAGRFFSVQDDEKREPSCVIGARLARQLFPTIDPIQKEIWIGDDLYRVIGVIGDAYSTPDFENKPLWFVGENADIYVPMETYRSRSGDKIMRFQQGSNTLEKVELHEVILTLNTQQDVMTAASVVRDLLARYHRRQDYEIVVPLQLIRQAQETRRLFNIVLGSIAAISLIVGGIGIMNIMLATVSERTREIGIRRALGACRRDIVIQFLVETTLLSTFGGVVGLIGGAIIPMFITLVTHVKTVLTPSSFIVAFSVSVAIGIVFGIYPARRAALMDPIEALRHE